MTVHDWDPALGAQGITWRRRGQTVAGRPSLTGLTRVASIDAGYWMAEVAGIVAVDPASVRAFRALMSRLEGGAHQIRLPAFDGANAPWPLSGGVPVTSAASTEFTDGTRFTDGTGFFEPSIRIALKEGAVRGATQVTVTVTDAAPISGGEYFTLGERLHEIREVLSVSGADQTWWIWPRLRRDHPPGAVLNFDTPTCLMRLAGETDGDLALDMGRWGRPTVAFVESFLS